MIIIETREEYDYAVRRGYEPLADSRFKISHPLRVEIQRERFGRNDAEGNQKFYSFCLKRKSLVCEECGKPIRSPSAINVSHILTKGAHPEMSHDIRNINILCPEHHEQWEHATTRKGMRIFEKNQIVIENLKNDYNVKC